MSEEWRPAPTASASTLVCEDSAMCILQLWQRKAVKLWRETRRTCEWETWSVRRESECRASWWRLRTPSPADAMIGWTSPATLPRLTPILYISQSINQSIDRSNLY